MKEQILYVLRTSETAVSGQELSEQLQVSRTAVWKTIRQLQEEGYQIEATQNRGYRLLAGPDMVSAWEVGSRLMDFHFLEDIYGFESVESTNKTAKELAEAGKQAPFLVLTKKQTGGRGRRGRSWSSAEDGAVMMSYCLKPEIEPAKASVLTLAAGLAVSEAIDEVTGLASQIKWPNDVIIAGKKICGILTEMSAEPDAVSHIVVGIGINVNVESFPDELKEKATSVFLEAKKRISRAELIAAVTRKFARCYEQFLIRQDMSALKEAYQVRLVNLDQVVQIERGGQSYRAVARGITDDGALLVEQKDGTMQEVLSGEVSVRGVYGYV